MSKRNSQPTTATKPRRFLEIPELTKAERERFDKLIDRAPGYGPNGDCWRWKGAHTGERYPAFQIRGRVYHAHRLALRLASGEDFPDRLACHKCDTPGCVRAEHLFAGTPKQNHDDMREKGRAKLPPRKGKSVDGERRTNRNAPDARPGRENHHRPDGTS